MMHVFQNVILGSHHILKFSEMFSKGSVYLLPVQFKGSCHTCDLTPEITRFFCPSEFVWFRILYHTNLLVTPNHTDSSIENEFVWFRTFDHTDLTRTIQMKQTNNNG
jgi:hypothetical protein